MNKASYSDHEFSGWVQVANDAFEEGRESKAFRILNRTLKHYDKDIPAYIYFKYHDLWKALEEEYEVDYEIEQMSDDELSNRISDAMQKNHKMKRNSKKFQRMAKGIFEGYLKERTSIASLEKQLTLFEKEYLSNDVLTNATEDEIISIFRAYFYDRREIQSTIVRLYDRFLREFFDCETLEEQLRNCIEEKVNGDEDWPEPIRYAIRLSSNPPSWSFIDLDPTIYKNNPTDSPAEREEKNVLAMVQSEIILEKGSRLEYDYHNGCHIIANWFFLMEQYPQLMDKIVKRGEEYKARREVYFKRQKQYQEQNLMRLSDDSRERIVKIWNAWDDQWIDVV